MTPIRVLIVDDSKVFCKMIHDELEKFLPAGSEILTTRDAFAAWSQILTAKPDVILLDEEMPRMNGINFLRWMKNGQVSIPTALMSGNPAYEKEALEAGAAIFLSKPSGSFIGEAPQFFQRVRESVAQLAKMPASLPELFDSTLKTTLSAPPKAAPVISQPPPQSSSSAPIDLIAIGASTGGPEALSMLLAKLKPPLPPILIVQHIPAVFSRRLADRLDIDSDLHVAEAVDGEIIQPNHVYIAPGGKHLRVRRCGSEYRLSCTFGPRVNSVCPSADVLFESVAKSAGANALGVIMTGLGADGARGLLGMREAGAPTIGQDADSCTVYGMPRVAWERGAVAQQVPLQEMAAVITAIALKNRCAAEQNFTGKRFEMAPLQKFPDKWQNPYAEAVGK